ncbi:carboxylesterase/lipase family protein [Nocardia brasiliensis]|uniref:carboxylesterase/lipase family protein n=1 Tax=Nocardia brasiliensis TaxID=37326 RepID=UPI002454F342|nr:carboxylesterase family protein [Nocardia brasiliensis]
MEPVVAVTGGKISGRTANGISAFLGVPYAAPPVGAALFQAPQPPVPWEGVREAVEFGGSCPQAPYPPALAAIFGVQTVPGAEALNVNVWTPDPGGSGLPVMVWIHGGAFTRGSNALPAYDGAAFARDGVVLVSLNYRLGAAGFAVLDGAPSNRGLLDQQHALAWVQENIRGFGGDPGNVTVFGESAGAMSIAALLASPRSAGLFAKAIMQSGNGEVVASEADARKVSAEIAATLAIAPTAADFAAVPPDALIAAQEKTVADLIADTDPARWGASVITGGLASMSLFPVLDGVVLHERPIDAVAAGSARGIPLLIGHTSEEFRLFIVPTGVAAALTMDALPFVLARYRLDASCLEPYIAQQPRASAGDLLAAVLTDHAFRFPARQLAHAQAGTGTPVFAFEFAWRRVDQDFGAFHALELPFVFDTLDAVPALVGPNPAQSVADEMHTAWVAFARTGDPGWPRDSAEHPSVRVFDAPAPPGEPGPVSP